MANLPIVVGVTGHRDLRVEDYSHLRDIVHDQLQSLKRKYLNTDFVMLNSLAEGSDQLIAEVAIDLSISLIVPLPLPQEVYRNDFSGEALESFDYLIKNARDIFVVPDIEGKSGDANYYYRQAGIYISQHCHILFALWDGQAPLPEGCGTSETVDFMLNASYIPIDKPLFGPYHRGSVIHIVTPRMKNPNPDDAFSLKILNDNQSLNLKMIDVFNSEIVLDQGTNLINPSILANLHSSLQNLHSLYLKADVLSVRYRDKHVKTMKLVSVISVLIVLAFLLYDEINARYMLPMYGTLYLLSSLITHWANKRHWQRKYLDYRVFAETLRVQFYLSMCGSQNTVSEMLTWSQRMDFTWIEKALTSLILGSPLAQQVSYEIIREQWIDNQLTYHRNRQVEKIALVKKNERISSVVLLLSLLVYIVLAILELFYPDVLLIVQPLHRLLSKFLSGTNIIVSSKGMGIILLGVLSSIILFLTNYYGKLSLKRVSSDHGKMVEIYQEAQRKWDKSDISHERVAYNLAYEEISENAVWLSYSRDNTL